MGNTAGSHETQRPRPSPRVARDSHSECSSEVDDGPRSDLEADLQTQAESPAPPPPDTVYANRDLLNNRSLASGLDSYRLSAEDIKSPWFHRSVTRAIAHDYLRHAPDGSFLIRPASHRGLYALTWNKSGAITDNIIYCLCPGYSLKRAPKDAEKSVVFASCTSDLLIYSSLSSLVRHCPFLKHAVPHHDDEAKICAALERRLHVFLTEALEGIRRNTPGAASLEWEVSVLDSLETGNNLDLCERRTLVRYGQKELVLPWLFPVTPRTMAGLAALLASPECRVVQRLRFCGHEGIGRQLFTGLLTDDTFVALCQGLAANRSVHTLDVRLNRIGDEGAAALAALLVRNTTLRHVDLSNNFVTRAGALQIAAALRCNGTVDEVQLCSQYECSAADGHLVVSADPVLDAVVGAVQNALLRKKELLAADQQGTPRVHGFLSDDAAAALMAALRPRTAGLYVMYLHAGYPDCIRLAFLDKELRPVHHTIQRVEPGYTCAPSRHVVPSLARYASWALCAANGDQGATQLSEEARSHVQQCRDLRQLWRVETLQPEPAAPSPLDDDPWTAAYPSLFYLTCGLRKALKVPVIKTCTNAP